MCPSCGPLLAQRLSSQRLEMWPLLGPGQISDDYGSYLTCGPFRWGSTACKSPGRLRLGLSGGEGLAKQSTLSEYRWGSGNIGSPNKHTWPGLVGQRLVRSVGDRHVAASDVGIPAGHYVLTG
jgi:hypothetical protein